MRRLLCSCITIILLDKTHAFLLKNSDMYHLGGTHRYFKGNTPFVFFTSVTRMVTYSISYKHSQFLHVL